MHFKHWSKPEFQDNEKFLEELWGCIGGKEVCIVRADGDSFNEALMNHIRLKSHSILTNNCHNNNNYYWNNFKVAEIILLCNDILVMELQTVPLHR